MSEWGFKNNDPIRGVWPKNEDGSFVAPALAAHTSGNELECGMIRSLLDSFNIPTIIEYPNDGVVGSIILGYAGGGIDIFVPETMLEDAKNVLDAENAEALEENQTN